MTVAVVIPTIKGREEDLRRCLVGYENTCPDAEIYIEAGYPSCGEAWIAGAERAVERGFDYIHFTADDLEPHEGWLEPAVESVEKDFIPSPVVFHPDGTLESAGLMGFGCYTGPHHDGMLVEGTTVPFLRRDMWERIGMIPVHYCTDLWVSHQGRKYGWETVLRTSMEFTHYNAPAGRNYGRVPDDTQEYLRSIR